MEVFWVSFERLYLDVSKVSCMFICLALSGLDALLQLHLFSKYVNMHKKQKGPSLLACCGCQAK